MPIIVLLVASLVVAIVPQPAPPPAAATVAEVYYWKARPGKLEEYNRYIRDYAGPIDLDARSHGAFVSVTTLVSTKPDSPWTHMRIFLLRDRSQEAALAAALDAAKLRLHPDEAERNRQAAYAETLRDLAGHEVLDVLP